MFRPNEIDGDHAGVGSANETCTEQYAYARLDRISAALIDSSRIMELLSFSSRGADLRMSVTKHKTRLAFAVGNIQFDQQSLGMNTKVPVILAPTPVKLPLPTVQFMAWKDNIRSTSDMESYEYVAIEVSPVSIVGGFYSMLAFIFAYSYLLLLALRFRRWTLKLKKIGCPMSGSFTWM